MSDFTSPSRQRRPVWKRSPALRVVLELEQAGRIMFEADTHEDELRLRRWLRRSSAFEALPDILGRLLDDLDEADQRTAA